MLVPALPVVSTSHEGIQRMSRCLVPFTGSLPFCAKFSLYFLMPRDLSEVRKNFSKIDCHVFPFSQRGASPLRLLVGWILILGSGHGNVLYRD